MKKSVKTGVVATRTRNGFREVLLVPPKKIDGGCPRGNLIPRLGKKRTALEEAYEEQVLLGEIRNSRRAFGAFPLDARFVCHARLQLRYWPEKARHPTLGAYTSTG